MRLDMSDTLAIAVSQSRDDHRHQPDRRPVPRAGRGGHRHRQPARQRPHRQGRRRALHLRRTRRRDERGVDQGLLLPGRGRRVAVVRHRRGDRASAVRRGARSCSRPCARCPTAMRTVLTRRAADRRDRPAARAVEALLGHRRQRPQQSGRRRGADQAQRALLQVDGLRLDRGQEAHRPLLRAADPRVRSRPRGVDGRRRREGSRHLPSPQGDADRRRQ